MFIQISMGVLKRRGNILDPNIPKVLTDPIVLLKITSFEEVLIPSYIKCNFNFSPAVGIAHFMI